MTLVEVDVTPHKDGVFVKDLRAEDFVILEDGQQRPVGTVTLVTSEQSGLPTEAAASGQPARRLKAVTPPGQIILLFFDLEHLRTESLNRAKRAADAFIARLGPRDIVSVVADQPGFPSVLTLDKTLARRLLGRLNPKGSTLKRELLEWPRMNEFEATRIETGDYRTFEEVFARACEEQPEVCPEPAASLIRTKAISYVNQVRAATARTFATLRSLAVASGHFAARKNVILISDGFYVGDSIGALQRDAELFDRGRMVVYGIDALGLGRSFGNWNDASSSGGPTLSTAFEDADTGMQLAAAATGGFVVRNRNDLGLAFDLIRADAASYYIVAYEPAQQGKTIREIEVKIGRPGVKVRHRRWVTIPTR